jgi:MinD-like ATPase involved in chromosome partitioning or flagellar assembly
LLQLWPRFSYLWKGWREKERLNANQAVLIPKAAQLGLNFLGEIPLDPIIGESSDAGKPITVSQPKSPQSEAYQVIAESRFH